MNDERSLERAARSFLEPGPTRAPEAAVEVALARIQSTSQERDWHVPWRLPTMTPLVRLATAAIVVAIAVGGSLLVLGGPGPGTGGPPTSAPSPTPVASPTPSPTPLPTLTASDVGDTLDAGTYLVDRFAAPFSVTVPAGWEVTELTANSTSMALSSDEKVNFFLGVVDKVYPDPCDTTEGPVAVGSGVDALVTALSSMAGFSVTDVRETTVGGASGRTFTITNEIDVGSADCSDDMLPFATYDRAGEDVDVAMFPGETDQFWVFEAGDVRVLMAVTEQLVDATEEVRDSLTFDSGSAP